MNKKQLCQIALNTMKSAYAPYSGYTVGAALVTANEKVYTGCNIENASYSATVCAERTAIFKAISDGERNFVMIAVAGGRNGKVEGGFPPCGICRQVMAEFCSSDFTVLVATSESEYKEYKLSELLPESFTAENMR